MNSLNHMFPIYFLMLMDRHGIKIAEGFYHDSYDRSWAVK